MDSTSGNWRLMAAAYGDNEGCAPREAAVIAAALLAELGRLHRAGKVFGAVDPAHVLLGSGGRAKLAEPGGSVSPSYQSPEQHAGQPASAASDLFAVGLVFYRLLTGINPFEGSAALVKQRVTNMVAPRPSEVRAGVPEAFDPVVAKALAKRPEERFASAEAFAEALMQALMPGSSRSAAAQDDTLATTVLRRPAGDDATVMRGPSPDATVMKGPPPDATVMKGPPPDATVMRGPSPDATVMRAPAPRAPDPNSTVLRAPNPDATVLRAPASPVETARGTTPPPAAAAPVPVPPAPSAKGGKGLMIGLVAAVVLAGVAGVVLFLK
jgi:serine/threonine-protein kinase